MQGVQATHPEIAQALGHLWPSDDTSLHGRLQNCVDEIQVDTTCKCPVRTNLHCRKRVFPFRLFC